MLYCAIVALTPVGEAALLTHAIGKDGVSFFQPNPPLEELLPKLIVGSRLLPGPSPLSQPRRVPILMYDGGNLKVKKPDA